MSKNVKLATFTGIAAALVAVVFILAGVIISALPVIGQVTGVLFLSLLFGIPTFFGLLHLYARIVEEDDGK